MSKKFAIFGDPVEHSLSPKMHNAAFKELGFNGEYFKIHLKDGSKLKEEFFKQNLYGANITVPHKEWAYKVADYLDSFAKEAKVVNTLVLKNNKLYGYNTDAPGFLNSIKDFEDIKTILILGAGGTAKSTSIFLRNEGYEIIILNRTPNRLINFKKDGFITATYESLDLNRSYDLIVNMTSAGLKDNNLPAPQYILEELFRKAKGAIDIIYAKETPFLKMAKESNLLIKDGSDMLIEQGVLAFDYFTNHKYDLQKIKEVMTKAIKNFPKEV